MGLSPLTWMELEAYSVMSKRQLTGWESDSVMAMSRAYVSMARNAESITCIPPYQRELTSEEWAERAEQIKRKMDRSCAR